MKAFAIPESVVPTSGVVTLANWMMMPDGDTYLFFWAERWEVLADAQIALTIPKFKSAEHWTLAAMRGNEIVMLIPGCQVKAWFSCPKPPQARNCYAIDHK